MSNDESNSLQERLSQEYKTILEVAGDAVYLLDNEGEIRYANRSMAELTQYSQEELLGVSIQYVLDGCGDAGAREFVDLVYEKEEGHRCVVGIDREENDRVYDNHAVELPGDGREGVVGVLRDVTAQKEHEKQLEEFASVVSHDLRNPLNVSMGRVDIAKEMVDEEDPAFEHISYAEEGLERMEELITDILELARERTNTLEKEPVSLNSVAEDAWENVSTETGEFQQEFGDDVVIQADDSRVKQLFENIFRNSIEHNDTDITVGVGSLPWGFYVEDDGGGVADREKENVFEMGYSTTQNGTGFGLSIVKEVVESHGWTIALTDSASGGARIEITGVVQKDTTTSC